MCGGLAFLLRGNMTVAASGQGGLLARVDPGETEAAVSRPHATRMEMRGRAIGWIRVAPEGIDSDRDLAPWVGQSLDYAKMLPAK